MGDATVNAEPLFPPDPVEDTQLLFIFTPPDGQSWNMTLEGFQHVLLGRDPEGCTHFEAAGEDVVPYNESLDFGFTLADGEVLEGFAQAEPQGAALKNCTAAQAAEFAAWLREEILPVDATLTVNTRPGLEWELPDEVLPEGTTVAEVTELLLSHVTTVVEAEEEDSDPSE